MNREAFNASEGVNVTGIQEDNLQLSIGQGTSVLISLIPSTQGDQSTETAATDNLETAPMDVDSFDGATLVGEKHDALEKKILCRTSYEIYLQQLFHGHVFVKSKDRHGSSTTRVTGQNAKDSTTLLSHFCLSLSHRIFSNKVLKELETVVSLSLSVSFHLPANKTVFLSLLYL